jgi:hypothetical protein
MLLIFAEMEQHSIGPLVRLEICFYLIMQGGLQGGLIRHETHDHEKQVRWKEPLWYNPSLRARESVYCQSNTLVQTDEGSQGMLSPSVRMLEEQLLCAPIYFISPLQTGTLPALAMAAPLIAKIVWLAQCQCNCAVLSL